MYTKAFKDFQSFKHQDWCICIAVIYLLYVLSWPGQIHENIYKLYTGFPNLYFTNNINHIYYQSIILYINDRPVQIWSIRFFSYKLGFLNVFFLEDTLYYLFVKLCNFTCAYLIKDMWLHDDRIKPH